MKNYSRLYIKRSGNHRTSNVVDHATSAQHDAAMCFTHYIAESQCLGCVSSLKTNVYFFSFLMNGTTDVSKTEDEAIIILYCKKDEFAKQM